MNKKKRIAVKDTQGSKMTNVVKSQFSVLFNPFMLNMGLYLPILLVQPILHKYKPSNTLKVTLCSHSDLFCYCSDI